ncbi:D-glutamate cyclase family protein [Nostocoides sp. F2B08]|uniref:D-glutamate cyclase family protein n=1 Tax=Nostocoides sp. F2B08 TaxID=2653936 RepID=UPI003519EE0A
MSTPLFAGDLRTDLPAYRVYEHGELVAEVAGVTDLWREDLVAPQAAIMRSRPPFAIGHAPGHMAITDARDSGYLVP